MSLYLVKREAYFDGPGLDGSRVPSPYVDLPRLGLKANLSWLEEFLYISKPQDNLKVCSRLRFLQANVNV